ncbi:alpha/beta hydrolase [Aliiglaciecola sp. CAU 1673]|uniref:alpha/beta fold hydrolase n=1 Tax=Aliiglaciecola sp. CAU 1673 TaxID=3032595 RepID=UPI0023DBF8B0|nr:alpha/beta hydrolase [Aliiglaciecola sp. CAU 1673]MDF2178981.1 alpha/beta hydrolase [Aliiglaciecola sp. CAU 1673]
MPVFADLEQYRQLAHMSQLCGYQIATWQSGNDHKPTLLLLHGFPSASWDWHDIWQPLSEHFQLLALDFLGFGLSDKPHPHRYSLLAQADIVDALLKSKNIEDCHVLAHDYGVSVAQELLLRQQQGRLECRLDSITFLNGGLFAEAHRPLFTQTLLRGALGPLVAKLLSKSNLRKGFNKIFAKATPPASTDIDAIWALLNENKGKRVVPALLGYLNERFQYRDLWVEAMQQCHTPLAFINGREDPISGEHMRERFVELLPGHKTISLATGHYPQLEAPQQMVDAFLKLIKPFTSGPRTR